MRVEGIVKKANDYVCQLFKRLPPKMYFHNLRHTLAVFEAATVIGQQSDLGVMELEIVQLAALFHNTGYLYNYVEHQHNSKIMASNYLMEEGLSFDFIEKVVDCIGATKLPQQPKNLLQQVICDAGLSHFAAADYLAQADNLKKEWAIYLGETYTGQEWAAANLQMLQNHLYFTDYARGYLQPLKQKNAEALKQR